MIILAILFALDLNANLPMRPATPKAAICGDVQPL